MKFRRWNVSAVFCLFVAACALTVSAALAGAGDLDPSFGGDGTVLTGFEAGSHEGASAVAVQPDGKIVVVGSTTSVAVSEFALVRYEPDGSLDPAFGAGGRVVTDLGPGSGVASAVALQADGKIVVAGQSIASTRDFAIARYMPDGSLDPSFGGDGVVLTDVGGEDGASGVAVQPDGRIVAAGFSAAAGFAAVDFALARYEPNGDLDSTFDGDGKVVTDIAGAQDGANGVAIQPDGRIVAVGLTSSFGFGGDFVLARYLANGALDASFDGDGKAITDLGGPLTDQAVALALQPDGKLVAAGASGGFGNFDFALARYAPDGGLDPAFGAGGKVLTDLGGLDTAWGVAIHADGKIVAVGSSASQGGSEDDFAVVRYTSRGALDPTFAGDGKTLTSFGDSRERAAGVAIQPDGKIVVVGGSNANDVGDIAVARYLGAGDSTPPTVSASLEPVGEIEDDDGGGWFQVGWSCTDDSDPAPLAFGVLNGVDVANGQVVHLAPAPETSSRTTASGRLMLKGTSFVLSVTCTDASGNTATASAEAHLPVDD
jgi:uncharacterized delta-60 repeat protein